MVFRKGNQVWKLRKTTGAPKGTKPWNTGKILPQWIRDKISKSHKGKKINEETRIKLRSATKNMWKEGVFDNRPIPIKSQAWKDKMSKIQKDNWKDKSTGFHKKQRSDKLRIARLNQEKIPNANTSIEKKIKELLDSEKIEYIQQYNLANLFSCDFYIPKFNMVIECDGTYWHSLPPNKKSDSSKNIYCRINNIKLLRLKEEDINKRIDWCKQEILKCLS